MDLDLYGVLVGILWMFCGIILWEIGIYEVIMYVNIYFVCVWMSLFVYFICDNCGVVCVIWNVEG